MELSDLCYLHSIDDTLVLLKDIGIKAKGRYSGINAIIKKCGKPHRLVFYKRNDMSGPLQASFMCLE